MRPSKELMINLLLFCPLIFFAASCSGCEIKQSGLVSNVKVQPTTVSILIEKVPWANWFLLQATYVRCNTTISTLCRISSCRSNETQLPSGLSFTSLTDCVSYQRYVICSRVADLTYNCRDTVPGCDSGDVQVALPAINLHAILFSLFQFGISEYSSILECQTAILVILVHDCGSSLSHDIFPNRVFNTFGAWIRAVDFVILEYRIQHARQAKCRFHLWKRTKCAQR